MAKKNQGAAKAGRFSIRRDGMDKINAVEGVRRSAASRRMFAEFDERGLCLDERRRALIAAHAKKS